MKNIIFSIGLILMASLSCQISFANVKDIAKYQLLAGEPITVTFNYQGKEAKKVDEDDFFDDTGSSSGGKKFECKGGSIVDALNCVTQQMENARSEQAPTETDLAESSERSNAEQDKGPIKSKLEVILTPKLSEDSKGNYSLKFDVKKKVSFSGDQSDKRTLERLKTEANITIPNDLEIWSASISQQTLEDFSTNKFDSMVYDLADQFQSARLYKLDSDVIYKMAITEFLRPDLVSVDVKSDQTNPYERSGGEKDVTSGYVHNLFGKTKTVRLLVRLKDFDWMDYGRPNFSDPNGEIDYRAVSYFIEGDKANQRERVGLFKEWGIQGAENADLVLVHAYVPAGALSNFKLLSFEGNHRTWELLYSDLAANFQFSRQRAENDWQPADFLMSGDRVRVELVFSKPPNLDKIPVWQSQIADGTSNFKLPLNAGKQLLLTKTDDARIYASEPIHIVAAVWPTNRNDKWPETKHVITIPPITEKDYQAIDSHIGDVLLSVDAGFRAANFLGPISPIIKEASVIFPVYSSPPDRTLWRDALKRTAACEPGFTMDDSVTTDGLPSRKKVEIKRWSINSIGFLEAEALNSDIDLFSVLKSIPSPKNIYDKAEKARPTAIVNYGHHAAMLLLRDELLRSIDKHIDSLSRLDKPKKLLQALSQMPYSKSNPFNIIALKSPNGDEMQFMELQWGRKHLQKRTGLSGKKLDNWTAEEMKKVVQGLQIITLDTARAISKVDQCDSRELLRVVTDVHRPISSSLIPKLIKPIHQGYQQYWVADKAAINWVNTVADLAKEVKYRDKEADIDNIALQFQLMALGFGIEGAAANFIYDLAIAGVQVGDAAIKYKQSQKTLVVDRGKALILGTEYYHQAEKVARAARLEFQKQIVMAVVSLPASAAINRIQYNWKLAAGVDNAALPSSANKLADADGSPLAKNSSTSVDYGDPKWSKKLDELLDDLDDVLPRQPGRSEDIFEQSAGARVSNVEDKEAYLQQLIDKSARGETLNDNQFLDKLELMRLKRQTKGGNINNLPDPDSSMAKSLPPTERMGPSVKLDDVSPNKTVAPPNKALAATEKMGPPGKAANDTVYDKGWQTGEFDPEATTALAATEKMGPPGKLSNDTVYEKGWDTVEFDVDPNKTVAPPNKPLVSTSKFDASDKTVKVRSKMDPEKTVKVDPSTKDPAEMATRIESGTDRVKQPAALAEESNPGLPEGQVDIFEQKAGVRVNHVKDKERYLKLLNEKSARGEPLTVNEKLDKIDLLRLKRKAKDGNINDLAEPDKTVKVGSEAVPNKTVKVDPSTKDPAEMATQIGSNTDRVYQPAELAEQPRPGLAEGQVDLFENTAGTRLAERGISEANIIALMEKSRRGEALTTDEMLTKIDYLRSLRSRNNQTAN